MSIRVQSNASAGVATPETNRVNETSSASPGTKGASRVGSSSEDHVEISSLSESIASANSSLDAQQSSRIRQLATDYANGSYRVDSAAVSSSMVSQAISSSASEAIN